jgi:prepilin-type N-terminal cleavage/methylation domain-containing protein
MRGYRKAFTLIEVLVVLVVLGILSGIAIARFIDTKEAAYLASMKADLRNLAIYEQNYLIESQGSYFAGNGTAQGFAATPGVTISATADPGPTRQRKPARSPHLAPRPGISAAPEVVTRRDAGSESQMR